MPTPDNTVTLLINGKTHGQWTNYDIVSDLLTPADDFSVTLGRPVDAKPDAVRAGDKVEVRVGGDTVLSGRIDRVQTVTEKGGKTLTIQGRDDAGVLLDCPLIVTEPDIDSQAQAQRKAKKRLADSRLEGLTMTATVQGHRTDDGTLWQPGQRINVLSEPDGIDAVYFLMARTFTGGRGQPTETVLTLKEDGAWVLDADPPKKSGKTQRPSESRKANGQAAAKPKKRRQAKQAGQEVQVI